MRQIVTGLVVGVFLAAMMVVSAPNAEAVCPGVDPVTGAGECTGLLFGGPTHSLSVGGALLFASPFIALGVYDTVYAVYPTGWDGKEWNTCADTNDARCYQKSALKGGIFHGKVTGEDSFLHAFTPDGKAEAAHQAAVDAFYHPGR